MRHALVLCALAVVSVEPAHAAPSYPWPAYSVVPVFFVPKDWDVNSTEVQAEAAALRSALIEIRQFYAHALGGNTFILNDLIVLQASGPKEKYGIRWNGGNIYTDGVNLTDQFEGAIVTELHDRGFPTPPEHGQIQWSADGSFTYTPEHNYAGTDRFEYVVRDTAGLESAATVTLKVSNTPDRPHAHHDTYRTGKNTKLCVKSPGVLDNDNDGDHDKLRAVLHKGAHHGHLDLEKNGSFCYRPREDFHGEDHFTYYAVDPSGRKDDATVMIHVDKHRD